MWIIAIKQAKFGEFCVEVAILLLLFLVTPK